MEHQKKDLPVKVLQQSLIVAIKNDGQFELANIDKVKINTELRKFKTESGGINYPVLFSIPKDERIVEMAKKDFAGTVKIISVAIALALEGMNLKMPMTNSQIFDLSETIIDDAESDNLSLEDLMLFLQKLVRGEYKDVYESMDIPKFMKRFGEYRDVRWDEGIKIRDGKIEEYKKLGDDNMFERTSIRDASPFGQLMQQYRTKAQIKRDEYRERDYDE